MNDEMYTLTFVNAGTRYVWIVNVEVRSRAYEVFRLLLAHAQRQSGEKLKIWQSDGAAEFRSKEMKDYLAKKGIKHHVSLPYTHQQQGIAEHMNRTLMTKGPRATHRSSALPDIPTPCSYAEAITGPYSSQWQAAMDAEMASWKSTGTYVDEVPPPGANIVDGMWIFRRDYELHSLDFSTAFLQGSLHEEICLRRPVYDLRQAPREWHDTLRTTLAALGFAPFTADPSLFLHTDTSLPSFYVLVYVEDLITRDRARRTITLTQSHMVHQVLQHFSFQFSSPQPTPLSTDHSLSAPPWDESVEPSGRYPELVGCLMYLMTCTRPSLAYPLSLLARYVAPGRHQKVHWDAAKRVLRYLSSTSGMGLVLGGRGPVVLTDHADASWVDDLAMQRLSQGYTFSLGSGYVSWRSTRSSSVLSSSCEAKIYAGAMAAQELC
ncbi:unnamed protein product [Closterium sp. NIES-53]